MGISFRFNRLDIYRLELDSYSLALERIDSEKMVGLSKVHFMKHFEHFSRKLFQIRIGVLRDSIGINTVYRNSLRVCCE